nr:MAG TPA_asm: hypothetical protein [Caudoviricetes sp.]
MTLPGLISLMVSLQRYITFLFYRFHNILSSYIAC